MPGTGMILGLCPSPELMPEPEGIAKAPRELLLTVLPPAQLRQLAVRSLLSIKDEMIGAIATVATN
ncbi:hypothetical protein ACH50O_16395 [Methylomonas sp. 2BW1-5-20]|uniref:hypothetical protein n=1 Tax=Methylomonas sp. 2BW1-5-20 TaxID=3376686 RepID=UPI00404D2F8C